MKVLPVVEKELAIDPASVVRVTEMGNVIEVFYSSTHSGGCHITKLDAEQFIVNNTGEVKQFRHMESRADDLAGVAKSLARGRDYINANVTDPRCCRWLTLTYAENMTDPKRLRKDFEHFNERLRRQFGHYEYIVAAEPQRRGAWHLHALLIFDHTAPFMANEAVADAWKRGFVCVRKVDDVDNVGAYLTAYLGDMDLTEFTEEFPQRDWIRLKEVEIEDASGQRQKKRFVKGARLAMYPPKFNIFRYSKGIKKPTVTHMSAKEANKKVSAATLTFEKSVALSDPNTGFESILNYKYYNTKRKQKSQE